MKLFKRKDVCAPCTASLWLIPTMSYIFGKVGGLTYNREWIWWVGIPTMFLIWVLLNWKIKK
jgi:hypothetical protein